MGHPPSIRQDRVGHVAGEHIGAARLPLSAAALAGGKSRRMGTDKAFLPLVDGGEPMMALVLARLRTIADDVMIVANDHERYEPFGARVVPDLHTEIGALGGIHAAVCHAAHEHCLVVACDMPFLNLGFLERMASEPRDYDVLVPVVPGESRQGREGSIMQTLHAIYSTGCLQAIEARIRAGDRRAISFLDDVRVRELNVTEIADWDVTLRSFFNVNTPESLATAAAMAGGEELFSARARSTR